MSFGAALVEIAREATARYAAEQGITIEEYHEREKAAQGAADVAWRAAEQARVERKAAEEAAFGARLGLGVPATVSIAVRLSGLTERSTGTGRYGRTVQHIRVLAPWTNGRITRREGEFLCRSGRPWDISDYGADAEVTCERCQTIAAKASPGRH